MLKDIQHNISLSKFTTYRIGGPAGYFFIAKSEEELAEALQWAKEKKASFFVLGGGSNILFSDKGYKGLVIKIQNTRYEIQNTKIIAGAGISLARLVRESVKSGLKGLEWAAGIPGTLGGAIHGNSAAYGGQMADCVEKARFLENGKIKEFDKKQCGFSYRRSIFKKKPGAVILSARLRLEKYWGKEERDAAAEKMKKIIRERSAKIPREFSAGSVFKNILLADLKPEIRKTISPEIIRDGKIPAGWLIEQCGLKGKTAGGACISGRHANFIVNSGKAKAADILKLIRLCKDKVSRKFGVALEEEIRIVK